MNIDQVGGGQNGPASAGSAAAPVEPIPMMRPVYIQPNASPPAAAAAAPLQSKTIRWAYGYFAVAVLIWNFLMNIGWFILSNIEAGWGAMFFFCGFVPSLGTIVWLILDSTAACCGGRGSDVTICGCTCTNAKWVMALPMAIFSALRMVLYVVLFGHLAHWMSDIDGGEDEIDTVFWIILFFASWDMGPMILIAIDFWYQYGKMSPNGVLGTRENPLRCVVAQSVLMCIASWSLIAIVAEYDSVEDVWAWVIHGILSTAALVFAVFCNYSGAVKGNTVSSGCLRMIWVAFAVLGGLLLLIVLIWSVTEAGLFGPVFYFFFYYYTALSLPTVVACASFKVYDPAADAADKLPNDVEMNMIDAAPAAPGY